MAQQSPTSKAPKISPKAVAEAKTKLAQAIGLHRAGRLAQAEWLYQEVLKLHPEQPQALQMLGVVLFQAGRMEQGVALLRKVVAIDPGQAAAHNNLGSALRELKHFQEAVESLDQAIRLKPDFADAYSNRGNALHELKQFEVAIHDFDHAIRLQPQHANAFNNRGTALCSLHRYSEALADYDRSIALLPNKAEAHAYRASALIGLQQNEAAVQSCDLALTLNPNLVDAHSNRAIALRNLKQYQAAAAAATKVLLLDQTRPYALGATLSAMLHACDWSRYDELVSRIEAGVRQGGRVDVPFTFLAAVGSAEDQLACARSFTNDLLPAADAALYNGEAYTHPKIKVAYLSADLHSHATAFLMAELFERHDRTKFEFTAYSFGPDDHSPMRARLEKAFDHFIDVSDHSELQIAQNLRAQEIDIAVDLKGFTQHSRPGIFAHHPAPIQVSYLGFPGTMGADYIDYIIGDHTVTPPEHDAFYAEKVVRLPDSYQVNDRQRVIAPETPTRAACGLPDAGFVFCCFNNNYKITPDVFGVWMRLLHAVPGSVLWLLEDNADAARNLRKEAVLRGISSDRLVFAARMQLQEHLARHRLADLFLDTIPCNAHTTTSDALWAGLPVLTCLGGAFAGRVAASLLRAADLPELVTHSLTEYEALALQLATEPDRLATLRTRLAEQRDSCALFDTERFRLHLESAYTTMVERHRQGLAPQSFAVQALPLAAS